MKTLTKIGSIAAGTVIAAASYLTCCGGPETPAPKDPTSKTASVTTAAETAEGVFLDSLVGGAGELMMAIPTDHPLYSDFANILKKEGVPMDPNQPLSFYMQQVKHDGEDIGGTADRDPALYVGTKFTAGFGEEKWKDITDAVADMYVEKKQWKNFTSDKKAADGVSTVYADKNVLEEFVKYLSDNNIEARAAFSGTYNDNGKFWITGLQKMNLSVDPQEFVSYDSKTKETRMRKLHWAWLNAVPNEVVIDTNSELDAYTIQTDIAATAASLDDVARKPGKQRSDVPECVQPVNSTVKNAHLYFRGK